MPVDRAQQRIDVDEHLLVGAGQQIDPPAQRHQMLAQHRLELAGVTEGELPQQRSDRRRCVHAVEQRLHPAAAQHVDVVDAVRTRTHARDQGGQLRRRVRRPGLDPRRCFRFPLSFREVEELMLVCGVAVSYETIRRWCAKFGQAYANQLRRRRPRPGDKWRLDEVFVGINGRLRFLWGAVDQHGNVLDVLVQSRRNAVAAKRFFRKLLKGLRYVPRVLVTDKLGSYQVAHRALMSSVEHRRSRYLNDRAENSHQPTRQRERAMKRFKSSRHAQRFLSAFSGISAHFRPRRHLLSATEWRTEMADRFAVWRQVTAPDAAA